MRNKFYLVKKACLLLPFFCAINFVKAQQVNDYHSLGTGVHVDLSSSSNWQYWDGSVWQTATSSPFATGTNTHQVGTNGTITIQSADTWDNATALSLASRNATILFNGLAGNFTSANKLTLNSNTYQHNSSASESTIAAGISFSTTSTTIYSYSSGTVPSASFGSLTIPAGSTYSLGGSASTVASGTLKVDGTLNCGSNVFSVKTSATATSTLSGSGTITASAVGTRLALGSTSCLATNINFTGTLCGVTLWAPVVLQNNLTISASGYMPQYYFNVASIYTDLNGYTLNCGSINGTTANIQFKNTSAGSITTSSAGTIASNDGNPFNNLTLGGSTGLNSNVTVNGSFTQSSGTFTTNAFTLTLGNSSSAIIGATGALAISTGGGVNLNNRPFTIQSSSSGSGKINQVSGTLSNMPSGVTVQRYIGNNNQWRMVGFPFTAATAISQSALAGFFSSGFLAYTYNEASDDGTNYGGTNGTNPNAGWAAFNSGSVSATKGILLNGGTTSSTINFTGALNTGTQTIPVTKNINGWNLIANPFPSNINWTSIASNNASLVNNAIYRFDPTTTSYATYVNGVSAGSGNQSNVIENGAGFFVQAIANGNLTIQESDKTTSTATNSLMGGIDVNGAITTAPGDENNPAVNTDQSIVRLTIKQDGEQYGDQVVLRWGGNFNATDLFDGKLDAYDLGRMKGADISVVDAAGTKYSIFHGSMLADNSTEKREVKLSVAQLNEGSYTIEPELLSSIANNNQLYLYDHYLHQYSLVDNNNKSYSFSITADAASQASNRFSMVFNVKETNTNNIQTLSLLNNPVRSNQFFLLSKSNFSQLKWQLIDNNGRVVNTGTLSNVQNGAVYTISTSAIVSGVYYVKLVDGNGYVNTLKLIKE